MSAIADSISVTGVSEAGARRRRIVAIIGASSGNLVEWYDFYAYAFTSIYFASAFFPSGGHATMTGKTRPR
jgi:MHS family alpha-ketoglutarate permease-like MFS transporter